MKENSNKLWLITVSSPICGTDTYYCAFSEENPLEDNDFPCDKIIQKLWDDYSYLLHLEYEEYDSEEEEREAYDEAYEDWSWECHFEAREISPEEAQNYIPGGPSSENDLPEIIYIEKS